MVETPKALGKRQAARRAGWLLLCLAWLSTAAAGTCLPHAHSPGDSSDRHERADHVDERGDTGNACCLLTDDVHGQPALASGISPAKSKPAALPARDTAGAAKLSRPVASVSARADPLFPSPPFYLLYNRLLIPAFS